MRQISLYAILSIVTSLQLSGCSGKEEDEEAIECCMLRELASNCRSPNNTASLNESISDWESVGESGSNDACIALVEDETLGCSSSSFYYDESDAIVDCSE